MKNYDLVLLTDRRYVQPENITPYIRNILTEDELLTAALEKKGLKVFRTNWDNKTFDWSSTSYILFRTTWDYFDRFDEFKAWLEAIKTKTTLINPYELVQWNMDKHYLQELSEKGILIPETIFAETGSLQTLSDLCHASGWEEFVLKPAVSGAGRHTYKFDMEGVEKHEETFRSLIKEEAMLLQKFQPKVVSEGEIALMLFGGKFSHAVLKKAKSGDFRVQDDFGGSVHPYTADKEEIEFAEKAVATCPSLPVYARVDLIRNTGNELCVSEVELIEPELWMRMNEEAAPLFAHHLNEYIHLLSP